MPIISPRVVYEVPTLEAYTKLFVRRRSQHVLGMSRRLDDFLLQGRNMKQLMRAFQIERASTFGPTIIHDLVEPMNCGAFASA